MSLSVWVSWLEMVYFEDMSKDYCGLIGDPIGRFRFSENWVEVRDGTLPRDR